MNKPIKSLALAATAIVALCGAEQPALSNYVRAMQSASEISAAYELTDLNAGTTSFSIAMAKPDKLRYENSRSIVVADGGKITYYDKSLKTFYRTDQTLAKLMTVFGGEDTFLWRAFFDAKSLDSVVSARSMGKQTRGSRTLSVVNGSFDAKNENGFVLYCDSSNGLLAQAQLKQRDNTKILNVTELQTTVPASLFSFTPPAGAREVSEEEMMGGKWIHDFDEAVRIGKATGKTLMVDFYATWCGPCKMMDAEVFQSDQFKQNVKDFVLVKVDGDVHTGLLRKYGVEAYPTVKFINPNSGQVIHEFVGYGGPQQVYDEIAAARSKK